MQREPTVARTVFGLKISKLSEEKTTASKPQASAVLITVPALPGS